MSGNEDQKQSDCPAFAVEIFQHIIDHLAASNVDAKLQFQDLYSCSTVSKDFLYLCQRHLFRSVRVGFYSSTSRSRRRLIQLLKKYPQLSTCIKDIRYEIGCSTEVNISLSLVSNQGGEENKNTSTIYDEHSITLHELLPYIRSIRIYQKSLALVNPDDDQNMLTEHILGQFSGLQSIESLDICNADVEVMSISCFLPILQHLRMEGCRWYTHAGGSGQNIWPNRNEPRGDISPRPYPLQRLILMNTPIFPYDLIHFCPTLEVLVQNASTKTYTRNPFMGPDLFHLRPKSHSAMPMEVSFKTLRQLDISDVALIQERFCTPAELTGSVAFPSVTKLEVNLWDEEDEDESLYRVLQHTPALQEIVLIMHDIPHLNSANIQLDRCLSLCQATLQNITYKYTNCEDFSDILSIELLCEGLSAIRGRNFIQSLDVRLDVGRKVVHDWMGLTSDSWHRMDSLLMERREKGFPHLSRVSLSLSGGHCIIPKLWEKLLPSLHSSHTFTRTTKNNVLQFEIA